MTKSYAGQRALDDLSISVDPGEFVALLGPSGCGKTTALRALAGLETIDSGTIAINGDDVTDQPTNKRDMGMVFQSYSLFPHLTAGENVGFGLRMRKVPSAERKRRSAEALDMVGLDRHLDRYAHELSGGQQQRVALARAL
ncbi:MAG TPA: ABC transporter ATP-binding protein, partial [Microbacteriaceae bacterium]